MFGIYFHAIVCHAAPQYELVCLRSTNAEDQERLFGQAESITGNTSNHHPNHVIPNPLLRIQAQANKPTRNSIQEQESKISKVASQLPPGANTYITKAFIKKRQYSWQAHLVRIAPYLKPGSGVWWREHEDGYEFLDGANEEDFKPHGTPLPHFLSHSLEGLQEQKRDIWKQIIEQGVPLPTPVVRVYDEYGKCIDRRDTPTMASTDDFDSNPTAFPSPTTGHEPELMSPAGTHTETDSTDGWNCLNLPSILDDITQDDTNVAPSHNFIQVPTDTHSAMCTTQVDVYDTDTHTPSKQPKHSNTLKTSWAKVMCEVLGMTDTIIEFDHLRTQEKDAKRHNSKGSSGAKEKHDTLLSQLQSLVLAKHTKLAQEIKDYEHVHLKNHLSLPDIETDRYYSHIVHTRNLAKKLLQKWNIGLF